LWRLSPFVLQHPPLPLPSHPRCQQAVRTLVLGPPPPPCRCLQVSCPHPSGMLAPVLYASLVAAVQRVVAPTEGPLQQGQTSLISTFVRWSSMVDVFLFRTGSQSHVMMLHRCSKLSLQPSVMSTKVSPASYAESPLFGEERVRCREI
jgi:hypothetical protein